MKISKLLSAFRSGWRELFGKPTTQNQRRFDGAKTTNLLANWLTSTTDADQELRGDYRGLINRCRDLERNNSHYRAWLRNMDAEILGAGGIRFQSRVKSLVPDSRTVKAFDAIPLRAEDERASMMLVPDVKANDIIETAWEKFAQTITVDGQSLRQLELLLLRSRNRDGSVLLRIYRGNAAGNKFGLAVQPLEIDYLALEYHDELKRICFGVEHDTMGRQIAFYIYDSHPGSGYYQGRSNMHRVPAEDVILWTNKERIGQTIGVPVGCSAITDLKVLNSYNSMVLQAAAVGAASTGFLKNRDGTAPGQSPINDGTTPEGYTVNQLEGGAIYDIGDRDFVAFDAPQPKTGAQEFVRLVLQRLSAGLGAAYTALTSDGASYNYSSMRGEALHVREPYKLVQQDMIDSIHNRIFEEFLLIGMTTQQIPLPISLFDKFNRPEFTGRRWGWVDPSNEVQATIASIGAGLMSPQQFCKDAGLDHEQIMEELSEFYSMARASNVPISMGKLDVTTEPVSAQTDAAQKIA